MLGTVALWTSARGTRIGVSIFVCGAILNLIMIKFNGARLDLTGIIQFLQRAGWFSTGLILPVMIIFLARQGAGLAEAEGLRAGRAAERVRTLRDLHDTALQTLGQIARTTVSAFRSDHSIFDEIYRIAIWQANILSRALEQDDVEIHGGLYNALLALVQEFSMKGMYVELVAVRTRYLLSTAITESLIGAVREALTNALKHAKTSHVVVHVRESSDAIDIAVRDQGIGFDTLAVNEGFGLQHSIRGRLAEMGGTAYIWSEPGHGTRVEITAPRHTAVGALENSAWNEPIVSTIGMQGTASTELISRGLNWFIVAALVYRIGFGPLQSAECLGPIQSGSGCTVPRSPSARS